MSRKNPRKNRNAKSTKAKAARRRTRRKKQSKLFAAIVIELIAAVALFGAYRVCPGRSRIPTIRST